MSKLIYIADDEENIRSLVKLFLKNEGYEVYDFENGDLLFEEFKNKECDLVILDVMMPGSDGFEICTKIREYSTVPILMLTARDSDVDYITGLTLGSDDYFTKPFSPMSLVIKVKAIFRRIDFENSKIQHKILSFADININTSNKIVKNKDEIIDLTPNEYNLITYLFENKERAMSRDEILNEVWGFNAEVETRVADDTVKRLRKKIINTNLIIETVWGYGFRLRKKDEK
ncbi:response regulator transcription factor [Terrisporobacter vanillatitrophus]|uniref:response regulator transcription factor n=1 Tax=Terrisporobacter vanillatitrophus TaxID=3058402 RepID=UPI003367C24E